MSIESNKYKENLIFQKEKSPDEFIKVNHWTFIELVKGIMIKYGNKTMEEATSLIENSKLLSNPINSYNEAIMFSHDLEYHWVMLLAYGEGYWNIEGVSLNVLPDYFEWEKTFILQHNLAESSFPE